MARRIRVYELARELGLDTKALITKLNEMGMQISNHMTALDEKVVQNVRRKLSASEAQRRPARGPEPAQAQATVHAEKKDKPRQTQVRTKGDQRQSPGRRIRPEVQSRPEQTRDSSRRPRKGGRRGSGKASRPIESSGRRGRPAVGARRVVIQGDTPVRGLASLIGVPVANVLRTIMSFGTLISINQDVPMDLAVKVAERLGCVVTVKEPRRRLKRRSLWNWIVLMILIR